MLAFAIEIETRFKYELNMQQPFKLHKHDSYTKHLLSLPVERSFHRKLRIIHHVTTCIDKISIYEVKSVTYMVVD